MLVHAVLKWQEVPFHIDASPRYLLIILRDTSADLSHVSFAATCFTQASPLPSHLF